MPPKRTQSNGSGFSFASSTGDPKRTTSTAPFKPPGPARRAQQQPASRSAAPARTDNSTLLAASSPSSDSDFGTALDLDNLDDLDIDGLTAPATTTTTTTGATAGQRATAKSAGGDAFALPGVPRPLLARIVHEGFTSPDTKMGREALAVLGRYADVFVREAVARAAAASKGKKSNGKQGEDDEDDIWVDAADLEEVAPGLVMDF